MFRHIVVWNLSGTTAEEKAQVATAIIERVESMVGAVPSIRSLRTHRNEVLEGENSDLMLIIDFDDMDGFVEYRDHPAHLEVGAFIKPRYLSRMAIDYAV
jgi:hypothetical protein